MGHIDGRASGRRIVVERQQPERPELLQHRVDGAAIEAESVQFGASDASTGVVGVLVDGHQPQEDPLRHWAYRRLQALIDLLGPLPESTEDTSRFAVAGRGQDSAVAALRQLGERVLHERKSAGLLGDVSDHLGDQARLQLQARLASGLADHQSQAVLVGHRNRHQSLMDQFGELGVVQGPVRRSPPSWSTPSALDSGRRNPR